MRALAAVLATLLAAADAGLDPAPAIAALQREWARLKPAEGKHGTARPLSELVARAEHARAWSAPCREQLARVNDTLGPQGSAPIVTGTRAALDRPGVCWVVDVPVTRFNELLAYLEPATGALLLAWVTPEG